MQSPEISEIQPQKGVSHPSWTAAPVAAGVMQHLGYWVMGSIDHGFCKSIYLAAPEGIMLEFSTSEGKPIDAEAWIDPEVVKLAGIGLVDLQRYKNPPALESRGGTVAQPVLDPRKPQMEFPRQCPNRCWN